MSRDDFRKAALAGLAISAACLLALLNLFAGVHEGLDPDGSNELIELMNLMFHLVFVYFILVIGNDAFKAIAEWLRATTIITATLLLVLSVYYTGYATRKVLWDLEGIQRTSSRIWELDSVGAILSAGVALLAGVILALYFLVPALLSFFRAKRKSDR